MKTKASKKSSKVVTPSVSVAKKGSWWQEHWQSHKLLVVVLIGIFCLYSPVLGKQFEQDEWFDTGSNQIYLSATKPFPVAIVKILFGQQPITQLVNFLSFYFFGVQNTFFAISALLLVLLNSTLWYFLIFKMTRSKVVALGSLLFAAFSLPAEQAITWAQPAVAYQIAFLGILLGLHSFYEYITTSKKKYIAYSLAYIFVAMLTRYNSFFIFPLLVSMAVIFKWSDFSQKTRKIFIGAGILFVLFGLFLLAFPPSYQPIAERFIHSRTQAVLNIFLLPTKTLTLLLVTRFTYLNSFAEYLVTHYYMIITPSGRELGVIAELLSVFVSVVLGVLYVATSKFSKNTLKVVVFFALFYWLTFAPYTFDKFSTATQSLESRYMFIPAFPLGALIFLWVENLVQRLRHRSKLSLQATQALLAVILSLYLVHNVYFIVTWELAYNQVTQKRIEVLQFAKEKYAENNDGDIIIFVQDINTSPATAVNVTGSLYQTGFMYPFLVYSYPSGHIPYQVFEDRTFWDMNYQGAKEVQGRRFGLFYDFAELQKYVIANKVPPRSIFALQLDYSQVDKKKADIFPIFIFADVKYQDVTKVVRSNLKYE